MNSSSVGVSIERRSAETKLADCHRKARFQLNFDSLGRDPRIPLALLIIHRNAWESSRDYNPSAGLERITAALLLINSAQDERNPPETGVTEEALKRVKNGRLYLIPASDETRGHSTTAMAKFARPAILPALHFTNHLELAERGIEFCTVGDNGKVKNAGRNCPVVLIPFGSCAHKYIPTHQQHSQNLFSKFHLSDED